MAIRIVEQRDRFRCRRFTAAHCSTRHSKRQVAAAIETL
jgi:hypothetical protein